MKTLTKAQKVMINTVLVIAVMTPVSQAQAGLTVGFVEVRGFSMAGIADLLIVTRIILLILTVLTTTVSALLEVSDNCLC